MPNFKLLGFSFLLMLTFSGRGQGVLTFKTSIVNLGRIEEEAGEQSAIFHYQNTGNKSLRIFNVRSSCGCTVSDWSGQSLAPGDSGKVVVTYNPANRPGRFKKSVIVVSDASNTQVTLTVEGYVVPKVKSSEDQFSLAQGSLRTPNKSLNMGKLTDEKPVSKSFEVFNAGEKPLIFYPENFELPAHISVRLEADTVAAGALGKLLISYDPQVKKKLGFSSDNIKLTTNDVELPVKEFFVISTTESYFPPMTDQELNMAPRLLFDKTVHDFGVISKQEVVRIPFIMQNVGRSKLVIKEIQTNCGCTVAQLDQVEIAPGGQQELIVIFDPSGKRGRQYKTVTVFSNDPTAPTQMLTIKAEL